MSRESSYTCDRCGAKEESIIAPNRPELETLPSGWASFQVNIFRIASSLQTTELLRNLSLFSPFDLCSKCVNELDAWIRIGATLEPGDA